MGRPGEASGQPMGRAREGKRREKKERRRKVREEESSVKDVMVRIGARVVVVRG